jgi:putative transposase
MWQVLLEKANDNECRLVTCSQNHVISIREFQLEENGGNMKCPTELFIRDNCFHFYNRAVNGEFLFFDDEDYSLFLRKFIISIEKYPLSVFAYCLMPNHFHFFLRQNSDTKIFGIFNSVLSFYAQKFNRKYSRKGVLMAGPLQSVLVDNHNYFLQLSRYIHLNPVKAKLVQVPEEWKYSNYSDWILSKNSALFDNDIFTLINMSNVEYKLLVEEYQELKDEIGFTKILFDNERI